MLSGTVNTTAPLSSHFWVTNTLQARPKAVGTHPDEKRGVIALIPARGGSKRVPRKNVRMLAGKPVIGWTIEAALGTSGINLVFFSTEDDEISRIAHDNGASVLTRPRILATDEVQLPEVVTYCLRQLNHEHGLWPERLCILQADCPLRRSRHIRDALDKKPTNGTVFSGYIDEGWHWKPSGLAEIVDPARHDPNKMYERRMKFYVENGAIYITQAEKISLTRDFRISPYVLSEMPMRDSIQIDTGDDFELCELRMKKLYSAEELAGTI